MRQQNNYIFIVLKCIIFLGVFVIVSESISSFWRHNQRDNVGVWWGIMQDLILSKAYAVIGDNSKSFRLLWNATEKEAYYYSGKSIGSVTTFPLLSPDLLKQMMLQTREMDAIHLANFEDKPYLARYFYNLGLIAYPQNPEITQAFWLQATYMAPHWSYFYLDLANLDRTLQQSDRILDLWNRCKMQQTAAAHCRQYESNPDLFENQPVGFMKNYIDRDL